MMKMKKICAIVAFSALVVSALGQKLEGLPVDVVHVFDRSGSVRNRDWRYFLNAAENVTNTIGAATGYYQSDAQNGLRASLITFACSRNLQDTRTTRVHLNQSGSPEAIADAFTLLRSKGPLSQGRTCLKVAAQKVLGLADPSRLIAVIIYSDGMVQDRPQVKGFAKNVGELNGVVFAVGTGQSMSRNGVNNMGKIAGGPDQLFQYQNNKTKAGLAEGIRQHASSTEVTPISVNVSSGDGDALTDPERCVDEVLTVRLSGVPGAGNLSSPTCSFFEDESPLGSSTARVDNDTVICDYAFNNVDSVAVALLLMDAGEVVAEVAVPVSRKFCFGFEHTVKGGGREFAPVEDKPLQGCVAVDQTLQVRGGGPSFAFLQRTLNNTLTFECAITKDGELAWQIPAVVQEGEDSFICEVTPDLLSILSAEEAPLQLGLAINETTGVRLEGLVDITVFPDTIAPPCVLPLIDTDEDLCLGLPSTLRLSGDTITGAIGDDLPMYCTFNPSSAMTAAQVADDRMSVSCPTPPLLGSVANFTFAVGNQSGQVEMPDFVLKPCASSSIPSGRLCAGDEYNVSLTGPSVAALVELAPSGTVICEIGNATSPALVDAEASAVHCAVPRWAPWSAEMRSIINVDSFSVMFGNVGSLEGGLSPPEICFETSSHGEGNRRLLEDEDVIERFPDCFPSCCKRESVTIAFAGNTIGVLSERPEQVNCAFLRVDGVTILSNVSFPSPNSVVCEDVEGWRPQSGAMGDYSQVGIQVLNVLDRSVEFALGGHVYVPSSANGTCVALSIDSEICTGIGLLTTILSGPTMAALEAFREESSDATGSIESCAVDGEIAAVEQLACVAKFQPTIVGDIDEATVSFVLPDIGEVEFNVSQLSTESCLPGLAALTTCPMNRFASMVVFNSTYPEATGLDSFICRLIGTSVESLELVASAEQDGFSCVADTTGKIYESVEILPANLNLTLATVPMLYDTITCSTDRSEPPTPAQETGLAPEWIALIVVLLVLLLLLIACLVYCCRYRKKDKDEDAQGLDEAPPPPVPEDLKRDVNASEEPEEPKEIALEVPDEEKGLGEAKDVVERDGLLPESPVVLPEIPPAKFAPDQEVEVLVFDEKDPTYNSFAILNVETLSPKKPDKPGQVWKRGKLVRKNSDNITYVVKLDDGGLERFVAEQAIREPVKVVPPKRTSSFQGAVRPDVLKEDGSFKYPVKRPLAYRELPENQFEMTIDRTEGLGIKLGITEAKGHASGGHIIISEFTDIPSGGWGPLEGSGVVGISDELLEINRVSIVDMPLRAVDKLIRESPEQMKLKFGRTTKVLSICLPGSRRLESV